MPRNRPYSRPRVMTRRLAVPRTKVLTTVTDGAIAAGTTRLTNLGAALETDQAQDLAGSRILHVRGWGTHISTVGGFQTYARALFVDSESLDAADVRPGTAWGEWSWWYWENMVHRGQAHNVLAAASEFDEKRLSISTRGSRKLSRGANTLWFAEEVTAQTQNVGWTFVITFTK